MANRLFTIIDEGIIDEGIIDEGIIDEGIVDGYDFFSYKIDIGDGYIDAVLTVENEGVITTDAKRDVNNAEVFGIMMKLKGNSIFRGEG